MPCNWPAYHHPKEARSTQSRTTSFFRPPCIRPNMVATEASLGYVRVCNQSQMTRERHFTSHRSMGRNTLRTPTRRSRGGALRDGEMEVQAMTASGLSACTEELRRRGDEVVVHLCTSCQCLRQLHSCTEEENFVEITIPYDCSKDIRQRITEV